MRGSLASFISMCASVVCWSAKKVFLKVASPHDKVSKRVEYLRSVMMDWKYPDGKVVPRALRSVIREEEMLASQYLKENNLKSSEKS